MASNPALATSAGRDDQVYPFVVAYRASSRPRGRFALLDPLKELRQVALDGCLRHPEGQSAVDRGAHGDGVEIAAVHADDRDDAEVTAALDRLSQNLGRSVPRKVAAFAASSIELALAVGEASIPTASTRRRRPAPASAPGCAHNVGGPIVPAMGAGAPTKSVDVSKRPATMLLCNLAVGFLRNLNVLVCSR